MLKQYDGYICYWYPMYDEIVQPLGLKCVNLLYLGMHGPRVTTKFEKEMQALLHEKEDTPILLLGTCLLHFVHTVFKNGISEVDFSFETFFKYLSFFIKLSATQREDYVGFGVATGIAAEFAEKIAATRWWLCISA